MATFLYSILFSVSVLIVSVIVAACFYLKYSFGYWKRKNVPYISAKWPFGNMEKLIKNEKNFADVFSEFYFDAKKKFLPYIGIYFIGKPCLLLRDPELVKTVLVKNFKTFADRGIYYNIETDPLLETMFHLSGPKWKAIRMQMSPMFSTMKIKAISNLFCVTGKELEVVLEEHVSKSLPVNIRLLADKLIMNNIGRTAFGLECNTFTTESIFLKKLTNLIVNELTDGKKWALSFYFPKLMAFFKIPFLHPETTSYLLKVFKETIEDRKMSDSKRGDFVDTFVKLSDNIISEDGCWNKSDTNENGECFKLSIECVAAQAMLFFVAGWETSSSTVIFSMLNLVENPDIQEKVRTEIRHVLKQHKGELTYEAVMEMKYLDRVINETLRMYPPIGVLQRQTVEPFDIPGTNVTLEPGTLVWISVSAMHKDPDLFPNPDKFDPDRFLNDINTDVFLPFGTGPKNCIGMRLGAIQAKFSLATLLKQHRYTLAGKSHNKEFITGGLTLKLKHDLIVDVQNIDTS